jgi:hypothetical protein
LSVSCCKSDYIDTKKGKRKKKEEKRKKKRKKRREAERGRNLQQLTALYLLGKFRCK